ncbi:LpqN/LpqT family lipoprotein [Mycobacteroides abscessus]|uniref:LpqN/LpqT family lipoprotein n=1 Tax=Mycobacteroides abscessus TaxID=36809 RepID=UPI001F1F7C58|nr:LpqN/LpqT family lipoprotein [Mycobacteroides abscessus]
MVFGALAAGCSSPAPEQYGSHMESSVVPSTTKSAALPGCADSAAPLLRLTPQAANEPHVAIPLPPGWERSEQAGSDLIRAAILNADLRANDFTPNAVVTLENLTGKADTEQQALDAERQALTQAGITITTDTPGSVCGHPSMTVTYKLEQRPVTMLIAAASQGNTVWAATVATQTTEPEDPTYVKDQRIILEGFQFQFPEQRHLPTGQ